MLLSVWRVPARVQGIADAAEQLAYVVFGAAPIPRDEIDYLKVITLLTVLSAQGGHGAYVADTPHGRPRVVAVEALNQQD
jgi:hypothetical protein